MKFVLALIVTALLAAGAWMGYRLGNDFLLYLFGLLAFAPVTAAVAVKAGVV